MKRRTNVTIAATLLALSVAGTAWAQQSGETPALMLIAADRIPGSARAQLASTDNPALLPGDTIEYQFQFTNVRPTSVGNVLFQRPMPAGLRYVVGSAAASRGDIQVQFSVDGGYTFAPAPTVEKLVNGQWVEQPAPVEKYTHVRWIITGTLRAGGHVNAMLRAVVPGELNRGRLASTPAGSQ